MAYRINSAAEFEMLGFDDSVLPNRSFLLNGPTGLRDIERRQAYDIGLFHTGAAKRNIHIENLPEYIIL